MFDKTSTGRLVNGSDEEAGLSAITQELLASTAAAFMSLFGEMLSGIYVKLVSCEAD